MLQTKFTNEFVKCLKRDKKRGMEIDLLENIINKLIDEKPLEIKHRDHALGGNYRGFRECHIKSDWLLVYYVENETIIFCKTGSHSDLFN